jgi:hypothetical protein
VSKAATVLASSSEEAFNSAVAVPNANAVIIKMSFPFPGSTWIKSRVCEANEVMILFSSSFLLLRPNKLFSKQPLVS